MESTTRIVLSLALALALSSCADPVGDKPDVMQPDVTQPDTRHDVLDTSEGVTEDTAAVDTSIVDTVDINTTADADVLTTYTDTDGDNIADAHEGATAGRDSDSDGTPDFEDTDSDNDGIDDVIEAGDADPGTPPTDSDGDGTPDYRDTDSDDNGILDSAEGTDDFDGDGAEDFRDFDNDNDGILDDEEVLGGEADCDENGAADPVGTGESPHNCNAGSAPDYLNDDTDGDGISDRIEGRHDTDNDGFLDRYELDSDNDGIPDSVEGSDDTDLDGIRDYRDPDSDDDGLTDDLEVRLGTNPTLADTDNDGVSDLIEYAAGTSPTDNADTPQANGDFVFEVPYEEAPNPERDTLQFRTAIRAADVYFSFDTSTTMIQEMDAMRDTVSGVPAIIDALTCPRTGTSCAIDDDCGTDQVCGATGVCAEDPTLNGCLLNLWTGVGSWHHIDSYTNRLSVQPHPVSTAGAIPTAPDFWVAPTQAPVCAADPSQCTNSDMNCASTGIGCPGFRPEAVPIYIQITDAANECLCGTGRVLPCDTGLGPAARCAMFTTTLAGETLEQAGIRFLALIGEGPAYGEGDATTIAEEIGVASGTVDTSGAPFVYSSTNADVVNSTVDAVRDIVTSSLFEITIEATDEPGDAGDALQFIERLEVNTTAPGCAGGLATADTNSDTFHDAFTGVEPSTRVCWDVVVRQNDTVEPQREPLIFQARLTVFADGSEVDTRTVYFLLPADVTLPPN